MSSYAVIHVTKAGGFRRPPFDDALGGMATVGKAIGAWEIRLGGLLRYCGFWFCGFADDVWA
jgi:hypothetical protein